jgi:hypothetical protein
MAGISIRNPLIVIPIDVNGIEPAQTIPSPGDEIIGMQCSAGHIELLVKDYKSGQLLMPLYTVEWHSRNVTTIREEQRGQLNVPKGGPTPPAIDHQLGSFDWVGNRAGAHMRGDWYVEIPQVVDRPNNCYEVHFVTTNPHAALLVTLLEQTTDKKKITKSVPLVQLNVVEVND